MIIFKFYRFIIIWALYYFRGLSSRLFRRNGVMWCTDILPGSSDWSIFGIRWNDSCCSTVSYSEGQVSFCNHKCVMFLKYPRMSTTSISVLKHTNYFRSGYCDHGTCLLSWYLLLCHYCMDLLLFHSSIYCNTRSTMEYMWWVFIDLNLS